MRKPICILILVCFLSSSLGQYPLYAQQNILVPVPHLTVSSAFQPPLLKGIKVYPENPFRFEFILDRGGTDLSQTEAEAESMRLIKYSLKWY